MPNYTNTSITFPIGSGLIGVGGSLASNSPPTFSNTLLAYPPELDIPNPQIVFTFFQYQRTSPFSNTNFNQLDDVIFLPIPEGIMENYNVEYEQFAPGWLAALELPPASTAGPTVYNELSKMMDNAFSGAGDKVLDAMKSIGGSAYNGFKNDPNFKRNLTYVISRKAFGYMSGDLGAAIDNYFGTAINPNTTIVLKAPTLRTHSFTWTFAPRTLAESDLLQNIKLSLQSHMLPQTDTSRFFLNYADIVMPEFLGTDAALGHGNYLYTFKPCVITDFSLDPAAGGVASFKFDSVLGNQQTGTPPSVMRMNLQLMEIMMFTKSDVGLTNQQLFTQDIGGNALNPDDTNVLPSGSI